MRYPITVLASLMIVGSLFVPEAPPARRLSTVPIPSVISDSAQLGVPQIDYHQPPHPEGSVPLVIILHGGGNKGNDELDQIAAAIARQGAVVAVPSYYSGQPRSQEAVLDTFENVVCSIRQAKNRSAILGADPENVTLVGFSYGAFPALAIALAPDGAYDFACLPGVSQVPRAVIGLGGAYNYDTQVATLGWSDGFAQYTVAGHTGGRSATHVTLVHGARDSNSPIDHAMTLYDRLDAVGHPIAFEVLDTRHAELINPADPAGQHVVDAIIDVTQGRSSVGRFGLEPVSVYARIDRPSAE